ncbi:unnamed protein product [Rhizophagus irregularis]|nr:unnamed protein product [Rhizophagus irregularis]
MTRGDSLKEDLRLLINNKMYSDIEISCEDEKILYGCRAILAARSEMFNKLLYNGMKESIETKISFPTINSSSMEIILEYLYTGSFKEDTLTKDNIIETFNAADYFHLLDLQKSVKNIFINNLEENYANSCLPELLSKVVKTMSLTEDNIFLDLLIKAISAIPLNTIEFDRLSIEGLKCLLSYTHDKEIPFVTPEYEVFRYSAILAAKQVSNDAYHTIMKQLPTLEQSEQMEQLSHLNSLQVEKKLIADNQKVASELEHLVEFINFKRIEGRILVNIIEPLEITPNEVILDVYRHNTLSINSDSNDIRGIPIYRLNDSDLVFDESVCSSKLIIEDGGKVVRASANCVKHQSARINMLLENKRIFEWDVIVEKNCRFIYIGVCSSENFNYEGFAGIQPTGWVVGSCGSCCNSGVWTNNYCPSLKDGTKITVHLNMHKSTCAFTINGIKYREVPSWNNLPSRLYPVVSLLYPGRLRIQPHQKDF